MARSLSLTLVGAHAIVGECRVFTVVGVDVCVLTDPNISVSSFSRRCRSQPLFFWVAGDPAGVDSCAASPVDTVRGIEVAAGGTGPAAAVAIPVADGAFSIAMGATAP